MQKFFGIQLVDEAKQFYKLYSIWFFAAVALAPDIYNLIAASGLFPPENTPAVIDRIIKMVALLGAIFRLVKQKVATEEPVADASPPPAPPAAN